MSFLDDIEQSPPPRRWYRRHLDGQLGYMVERHGREMIKLDRPEQDLVEPYKDGAWVPVSADRPINRAQVARIAYAADLELCKAVGKHEPRPDWASMSDKAKRTWVDVGPPADPPKRRELYAWIKNLFPDAVP